MRNIHRINGLIYITSEDDIKLGDYGIDEDDLIKCTDHAGVINYLYYKVILSNDTNLTSDGIQAIEPEAVKWLNENPKQEELLNIRCIHSHEDGLTKGKVYKAIKQSDWGFDVLCDDHGNLSGWDKRYFESDSTNQTIEEAAEVYVALSQTDIGVSKPYYLVDFAKSQAARDYWYNIFKSEQQC